MGGGNRPTRGGNVHALARVVVKSRARSSVTMAYRGALAPPGAAAVHQDRFWILTAAASAGPRRILPDGCIDMIVDVDLDSDGFGQAAAVGTMTRAMLFHPQTRVCSAAVRFRPGGAAPFLRLPAGELTNRVLDAGDAGARWMRRAPVKRRPTRARRWPLWNGACSCGWTRSHSRIARSRTRLAACSRPRRRRSRSSGASSAGAASLARRFRAEVGVGPNSSRAWRGCSAPSIHCSPAPPAIFNLAGTAVDLGYFDQAHMARDFREMAGLAPRDVRAARGSIFPIRSLLRAA